VNPVQSAFCREEILGAIRNHCENFEIERELSNAEGLYFLQVQNTEKTKRYFYQRKGSFSKDTEVIDSATTTLFSEDLDDGYSRVLADYDPKTGEWTRQ